MERGQSSPSRKCIESGRPRRLDLTHDLCLRKFVHALIPGRVLFRDWHFQAILLDTGIERLVLEPIVARR